MKVKDREPRIRLDQLLRLIQGAMDRFGQDIYFRERNSTTMEDEISLAIYDLADNNIGHIDFEKGGLMGVWKNEL